MDNKTSSYHFHCGIESPLTFFRREWKPVLIFGGGFCVLMSAAVFLIDPAFFYPRVQTDPLNYFLKAKALAETGTTAARWAVNLPPFAYVAMPGALRSPVFLVFHEFDQQLRATELLNIPIVAAIALMSGYVLSWVIPRKRHWLAVAFAFAFVVLSPVWMANVFLPLADAPYAAGTLAALIVSIRLLCSSKLPIERPRLLLAYVILFSLAFLLRFTAPVLLVFAGSLALGRWEGVMPPRRVTAMVIVLTVILFALLIGLNTQAIFGRYLSEPLTFLRLGDKPGMVFNLLMAALPSQVIPGFQQGFKHPPIIDLFQTSFGSSPADVVWSSAGLLVSSVVILGMWRTRRNLLPEIWYVLVPLPVLMLMLPSTTRYLMSYQAFVWIFFYCGVVELLRRYSPKTRRIPFSRYALPSVSLLMVIVVLGLRSWKVGGTASERYFAVTLRSAPAYVADVSGTFRALRTFLESLPKETTLLIGWTGTVGRWKLIADRDYYQPDIGLSRAASEKEVYLLLECGTLEACQAWRNWKEQQQQKLKEYGEFTFDSVFAVTARRSRVEVLRVHPVRSF